MVQASRVLLMLTCTFSQPPYPPAPICDALFNPLIARTKFVVGQVSWCLSQADSWLPCPITAQFCAYGA